jgi:hypothetical protein
MRNGAMDLKQRGPATATREQPFLAISIVGEVRDHLAAVVANGKLAQAD